MMKSASTAFVLAALLAVSACDQRRASDADQRAGSDPAAPEAEETGAVSILRSEVATSEEQAQTFDPLKVTIGFPDGDEALDADAVAELEKVIASPQIEFGGPIILRAHSDSAGTDKANEDASEARGLAVAGWLIDQGVKDDRIEVIVFGEQNPAQPNALPDGSPNEAGRKANRRVEIEILIPPEDEIAPPPSEAASGDDASVESGD